MAGSADPRISPQLSCVLVDDNEPVLRALETLLRDEGIDVVGTAGTGLGALQLLESHHPSTFVVDLRLPDLDGIEVTRRAGELARSRPAVIVYTSYADRTLVTRALDAGARAVVLKDAPPLNLLEAFRVVAAGGIYVDPQLRTGPREQQ
jgi:DNA-binding NarL/FixJ family response regulator